MSKAAAQPESQVIGRDESWMAFNRRVLEEARDSSNPILERVKFLAITASNLDEFVEIRVAGVLQRIEDGYKEPRLDGLTPQQSLDLLSGNVHAFVREQYLNAGTASCDPSFTPPACGCSPGPSLIPPPAPRPLRFTRMKSIRC